MVSFSFPDIYIDTSILHNFRDHEFAAASYIHEKENGLSLHDIRDAWTSFLRSQDDISQVKINFYVHIPFCIDKCYGCIYYNMKMQKKEDIDHYLDYLENYMSFFEDTFNDVEFNSLFIGGGTPNILDHNQLERFMRMITEKYKINPFSEQVFECVPTDMDEEKVLILKKYGINKLSIGVQSTNENLLRLHGRYYQNFEQIRHLLSLVKKHNIPLSNADILLGIRKQSLSSVLKTLEDIMKEGIDYIVMYRMNMDASTVPAMERALTRFIKDVIGNINPLLSSYGYILVDYHDFTDHSFKIEKIGVNRRFIRAGSYNDMPESGLSLFGVGTGSRSRICGHMEYRILTPEEYYRKHSSETYDPMFFSFNSRRDVASGIIFDELSRFIRSIAKSLEFSDSFDISNVIQESEDVGNTMWQVLSAMQSYGYRIEGSSMKVGETKKEKWHFLLLLIQKYKEIYG